MLNIILQVAVILFFITSAYAQTEEQRPILIDEFGRVNAEESFARTDSLNIKLSENKNSKAVIRIIGGEDCFLCHYSRGSYITAILKSRKYSFDKYSIEYCSENKELRIQFYLMPPNSTLPACRQTLKVPRQTVLFQRVSFFSNYRITPLENTYVESTSPADGEYSLKALKAAKDILDKSLESKIYILVYLGTNKKEIYENNSDNSVEKTIRRLDKRTIAGKMIISAINELVKNGIKTSQIKTVNGGYLDGTRELQFWFVPKSGEIPKPKPDYFPKKKQNKRKKLSA